MHSQPRFTECFDFDTDNSKVGDIVPGSSCNNEDCEAPRNTYEAQRNAPGESTFPRSGSGIVQKGKQKFQSMTKARSKKHNSPSPSSATMSTARCTPTGPARNLSGACNTSSAESSSPGRPSPPRPPPAPSLFNINARDPTAMMTDPRPEYVAFRTIRELAKRDIDYISLGVITPPGGIPEHQQPTKAPREIRRKPVGEGPAAEQSASATQRIKRKPVPRPRVLPESSAKLDKPLPPTPPATPTPSFSGFSGVGNSATSTPDLGSYF